MLITWEHSCSLHCIMPSYKEVHLGLVRAKMNCVYIMPISLGTQSKLLLQLPSTLQALVFSTRIPPMEGEEVFGSVKRKVDLPPRLETNSYSHDRMNFSCSKVANATSPINQSSIILDAGETNNHVHVITHNGAKVLKGLYRDNIWKIECYPSKSNTCCSMLEKYTTHYCKTKIISKQTNHGILVPCYVGYQFVAKGVSIELHNFFVLS